jgi:superfamily II DNA helicase RecQ
MTCHAQVERMKKAGIEAVALNEDTAQKDASKVLNSRRVHLILTSPEYLLRNPHMKKYYVNERARSRVLGVLVDEAHVIHEWAAAFRKDYGELKALKVILGNNVPWWALSATFTDAIFKTVYITLSFGTSRPFWGIDVGTERPNLAQYVCTMDSPANSYRSLILLIPEEA